MSAQNWDIFKQYKVVIFDIEILARPEALMSRYFQAYPGYGMGADISSCISFGYFIPGQMEKAECLNTWDFETAGTANPINFMGALDVLDDSILLEKAYKIMEDADILVTFYGRKFDKKFLNARLAQIGLYLDPKVKHIDLHQVSKRHFKLSRYRLKDILNYLDLPNKHETGGQELWYQVWKKDPEALKKMSEYCAQDVQVLANLFYEMAPFIEWPKLPKQPKATSADRCPGCGEEGKLISNGYRFSRGERYARVQCTTCGTWSRKTGGGELVL